MTTIVIAEINNGSIQETTKELISAAHSIEGNPVLIIPCSNASTADGASNFEGVSQVIAAKSDVFGTYDASAWADALDSVMPQGTIVAAASQQSKDLAARIAAKRNLSVVQDVVSIENGEFTSPIYIWLLENL